MSWKEETGQWKKVVYFFKILADRLNKFMILFKKEALKKAHTSDMFETIAGKKRKEQEVQKSKREYKM